jgi:hypothetical protein
VNKSRKQNPKRAGRQLDLALRRIPVRTKATQKRLIRAIVAFDWREKEHGAKEAAEVVIEGLHRLRLSCHLYVAVVLQWCCCGVAVVLQWCYSGVTVVSQWCRSGVTVVSQWCYSGVTVVLQWCHSGVIVVLHSSFSILL